MIIYSGQGKDCWVLDVFWFSCLFNL